MSNVELLPLPACPVDYTVSYSRAAMHDYARACVEANTEALRAELGECTRLLSFETARADSLHDRAERLAEELRAALALARDGAAEVNGATDYMPAGKAFDITKRRSGELFNRLADLEAHDALHPTAAQENDHA